MSKRVFNLYDTMTRQVKPLKTIEPEHLRFYSCGPTVYSHAHIGNFRTFLTSDLIVRTAESLGWKVSYVSNITDVGHLTQDDVADATGDDKMASALASKEGEQFANVWDLARHYSEEFDRDWRILNLKEPTVRPRATEHMREQIVAVEELIKNNHAYETPTGVYFRVNSFPEYGKLSGNTDRENLQVAVRDVVQDDNKEHPADFALWKKDDKHLMQWFSPWGWGFPGWHIECSVMAKKYLGETIDLHGGGEDLKFPHHECEIAQSESASKKPFSNHWLHVTFLQVDGEKMSKSKGNYYTVVDLIEKGANPLAVRFALIAVPYRKPLNFTLQTLKEAEGNVHRFEQAKKRIEEVLPNAFDQAVEAPDTSFAEELKTIADAMLNAMLDDLNTSVAIAKAIEGTKAILRLSQLSEQEASAAAWFLQTTNQLLGIVYPTESAPNTDVEEVPKIDGISITELLASRADAKANKDFVTADEIRNKIETAGYILRDSPTGTEWSKA